MITHKCEGLPGWECGRATPGADGWCIVHGSREDRQARWAMNGIRKEMLPPEAQTPVATAYDLALALQGELAL